MVREAAHEIDLAAADWVAKADRGLSAEEERVFERWLTEDPRRSGAYGRMRAIFLYADKAKALGPEFDSARFRPAGAAMDPSRRRLLLGGGGVIAAGLAAGVFAAEGGLRGDQRFSTRRGELVVTPLADGSVMTLNTASLAKVSFLPDRRIVRLIRGEALFDVARDAARPFLVEAGETIVRAAAASFTVSRIERAPVEILVRTGAVEITRRAASPASSLTAHAGMHVVAPTHQRAAIAAATLKETEVGRLLAWRDGRIAFQGETLAEAADQFARYSNTRILFADESIAAERITGLFQANDPVGFAQAVAASFDLKAHVEAGVVRLSR